MDHKLPGKGTPIVGHEYLTLLAQHTPGLGWDSAVKRPVSEHIFDYVEADRRGHRVYYPSLLSIHKRLQLAERQKVGISIWELGQVRGTGLCGGLEALGTSGALLGNSGCPGHSCDL